MVWGCCWGVAHQDLVLRKYEFDAVFAGDTPQQTVYEEAKDLLQMSMDGFNVCLFAYGQVCGFCDLVGDE